MFKKNLVKIKFHQNKFLSQCEKSVKCRQKLAKPLVGTFGVLSWAKLSETQ